VYGELVSQYAGGENTYHEYHALGSADALVNDTQVPTDTPDVDAQLAEGTGVAAHPDGLVHVADVLVAAFRDVDNRAVPVPSGPGTQAAEDCGPAAPHRDEPDVPLVDAGQFGVRDQFGIEVQPLEVVPCNAVPELDETHELAGLPPRPEESRGGWMTVFLGKLVALQQDGSRPAVV
jgi:hypothetical protein